MVPKSDKVGAEIDALINMGGMCAELDETAGPKKVKLKSVKS